LLGREASLCAVSNSEYFILWYTTDFHVRHGAHGFLARFSYLDKRKTSVLHFSGVIFSRPGAPSFSFR
jgi:hypothetical protein